MDDIPLPVDIPVPEEPVADLPVEPVVEEIADIKLPVKNDEIVTEEIENIETDVTKKVEIETEDKFEFAERHDMLNSRADVPVPGESEHEFYSSLEHDEHFASNENESENVNNTMEISNMDVPEPNTETFIPQISESETKSDQTAVSHNAMQNNQVQYPAANYMGYPPQMSDPSMMSHNYSYMTANSYSDYMSMYHTGRMPRPYANAYAPYQSYNYAYPPMQQMYDGRSMPGYPAGTYPQQMLPPTPPLPPGHPMGHTQMNNFNPPLPADYAAPSFSSEPPNPKKNENRKQNDEINANLLSENDLPPLPDEMPEPSKEISDNLNSESGSPSASASQETEELEKALAEQVNSPFENHMFSEDINRYSPSLPMEEDDASHQSETIDQDQQSRHPQKISSVLGKAQAKKRLMAFSISKQAAAAQIAAKKQAQASVPMSGMSISSKDRKENGETNVSKSTSMDESNQFAESTNGSGIFDDKHSKKKSKRGNKMEKARETIEEIEEIKRAEMSTLMYRQNLIAEAHNEANQDQNRRNNDNDDRRKDKSRRRSRSYSRSRSRRRSRSRSRNRKSRRRDKKYRRRSRSRTRSRSRSHSRSSSRQRDKKPKIKTSEIKSWADFIEAGFQLDRYRRVKFNENKNFLTSEVERRKKEESKHNRHRSRSGERRSISIEKEVMEENRKKKINMFDIPAEIKQPVIIVKEKGNTEEVVEYPSHIIQYTNTRPIVKYCENLKHASLHFINRAQLMESVPDDIGTIIKRFLNTLRPKRLKSKVNAVNLFDDNNQSAAKFDEKYESKYSLNWWSKSPLHENEQSLDEDWIEDDVEVILQIAPPYQEMKDAENIIGENLPSKAHEKINTGARKSRFEDVIEEKQEVSVFVRSRWDSDYEESPKNISETKMNESDENTFRKSNKVENHLLERKVESFEIPKDEDFQFSKSTENEITDDLSVNKNYLAGEKSLKINQEKSKYDEIDQSSEFNRKNKTSLESPEQWHQDFDYETGFHSNENIVSGKKYIEKDNRLNSETDTDKPGDRKLVSEYEEFLKMVSFEPPNDENMQLYEGPKPPPRLVDKSSDSFDSYKNYKGESKISEESRNPFASSDEEKCKMDVEEEEFDVDKFFLKEKEKKLKKLGMLNSAESESEKRKTDNTDFEIEDNSDTDVKRKKKHDKKEKSKKRKLNLKIRKNRKKKKVEKKKKYESSSDSSSDSSDDSDSDDTNSSDNTDLSTESTSSSSSSSSSDDSSSESTSKKKRKRSKKVKKKDKRKERKLAGKHKKKKKRRLRESDSDTKKKKRRSKNEDTKKKKTKKLPTENFLEFIEKSLAVSLNKPDSEGSPTVKKLAKEKRKKRKKKSDKEKKTRTKSLLSLIPSECTKQLASNLIEDEGVSETKILEKSPFETKKKKKKSKKKHAYDSEEEVPLWKKKKIVDPKEIEESVAKAQMNPFFEDNLDDWDTFTTMNSVVEHSMRDDSKNTDDTKDIKKKKKKKYSHSKLKAEEYKENKNKNKISAKKKGKFFKEKGNQESDISDETQNMSDENEKLTLEKKKYSSPLVERNFAMFASNSKYNELDNIPDPFSSDNYNFKSNYTKQTKDSFSPSAVLYNENKSKLNEDSLDSTSNVRLTSERYSPTGCDGDEDETIISEDTKLDDRMKNNLTVEDSSKEMSTLSITNNNFSSSSVFPYFSAQNIVPSPVPAPTLAPTPVPAPVPVPPPSSLQSHSFTFTEIGTVSKISNETETSPKDSSVSSEVLKNFGKVIITEGDTGYKSFSIGKLEVRTKAAKKFVHSNIFDSFDVDDHANLEAPCNNKLSTSENETDNKDSLPIEKTDNLEEDVEKEEFVVRTCIELPDIPISQQDEKDGNNAGVVKTTITEKTTSEIKNERDRSNDKYGSSHDHVSKNDRYERDDTRDSYRKRSRSRSHDKHKKRQHKDRYKRRTKDRRDDRSRSRSRRSRDRDSKDYRYRHTRRSFSRDRRRSLSPNERTNKKERNPPESDQNRFMFEDSNIKAEKEDKKNDDHYGRRQDYESERHLRSCANDSISEIAKCSVENKSSGENKNNADINALQENLVQLKETLKSLNKQGIQLDALHSVLSALENNATNSEETENEIDKIRRSRSPPTTENESTNEKDTNSKNSAEYKKIISLCQAIQSSLPSSSEKSDVNSAQDANKSNVHFKTKKSVADSTNSGFTNNKNRFQERTREISPKPLSLDERLELELGVRRSNVTAVPRQPAPVNIGASSYYQVPVYEGIPNFSTPPPPLPTYPPIINPTDRSYYPSPHAPVNWNNPEAFIGQSIPRIPPPVLLQNHPLQQPPLPSVMQHHKESSAQNQSYHRIPDPATTKVHSIQVGNVLQIVPTELQPPVSSQSEFQPPGMPVVSSNVTVSSSSQISNTPVTGITQGTTAFPSILSAHLPVSFAAAPAVSGSKSNVLTLRSNDTPVKEQKHMPNDLRVKSKELPPPPPVTSPPTILSGSKIMNLPLPPGTPETEMKKLIRLAKEKRKEEKVLQQLLKTPNIDENNSTEENTTDVTEELITPICIKPSPEQGILISPGFKDKSTPVTALGRSIIGSSRKMVSFVDGIRPGSVTVSSSPPTKVRKPSPPPKKKHKVRVKIIRPDDSDDDDSPPPPPPGPPPPELYPPTVPSLGILPPGFILPKL